MKNHQKRTLISLKSMTTPISRPSNSYKALICMRFGTDLLTNWRKEGKEVYVYFLFVIRVKKYYIKVRRA